jgi:hypothetical protein
VTLNFGASTSPIDFVYAPPVQQVLPDAEGIVGSVAQ